MRTVVLSSPFEKCGIKTYVQHLLAAMPRAAPAVQVIPLKRGWFIELIQSLGHPPSPDVVHCQHEFAFFGEPLGAWALPDFVLLKALSKLVRFKIVVTLHTVWTPHIVAEALARLHRPAWLAPGVVAYLRLYYRVLSRIADRTIATTEEGAAVLEEYGIRRPEVIPLGAYSSDRVSDPEIRAFKEERLGADSRDRIVLLFGYAFESKGYHYLVAALPRLLALNPTVRLVVTGGLPDSDPAQGRRYLQRLRELGEELRVSDRVTFLGHVPDGEVPVLLSSADVLAFPFEERSSSSASLFEVLGYGVPLITSRARVFDFLRDGKDCLKVDPQDAAALADAVNRLLTDPALRARLLGNLARIAESISIATSAESHVRLYASLGEGGRGRPGSG